MMQFVLKCSLCSSKRATNRKHKLTDICICLDLREAVDKFFTVLAGCLPTVYSVIIIPIPH